MVILIAFEFLLKLYSLHLSLKINSFSSIVTESIELHLLPLSLKHLTCRQLSLKLLKFVQFNCH